MQLLRTVDVHFSLRDIEVRADGHIFAHFNDRTLRHYDPAGTELSLLNLPNSANHSMAMSADGTIVIGSGGHHLTLTDTTLAASTEIELSETTEGSWGSFVAFGTPVFIRKPGDVTGDGAVGIEDLDLLLANWGDTVATGAHGDLDASGLIDSGDLQLVIANWDSGTPPASIPEPGTVALLVLSGCAILRRRR